MIIDEKRMDRFKRFEQEKEHKPKFSTRIKMHWDNRNELFSKMKQEMKRLADVEARYARRANISADLGKPCHNNEFYEIEQYIQVLQAA